MFHKFQEFFKISVFEFSKFRFQHGNFKTNCFFAAKHFKKKFIGKPSYGGRGPD
jgi:hypothetical protein